MAVSGFWRALLAIAAGGIAIRVLYTLLEAPWPPPGLDDQFYFSALPKLVADGEGFVNPFLFVLQGGVSLPTAEHPPLHTVVLAGLAELGGTSPDAQRLTGAVFGAGTIVAVALLARRLAGERAGLVAAGLAAVYPVLVATDGALMSESLYVRAGRRRAAGRAAPGRGAERRPRAAVLGRGRGARGADPQRGPAHAPARRAPAPAHPPGAQRDRGRRRRVRGGPHPVDRAHVERVRPARRDLHERGQRDRRGQLPRDVLRRPARRAGGPSACRDRGRGNEAEHMAELRREGVRYARDHAGRLPTVLAVRLARVWNVYDPLQLPEGRSARAEKLGVAMYFPLVALALAGALTLRHRRRELWILAVPVVLVCVTALVTYGNQRFRAPAEITLVVLAALALDAAWRSRPRSTRRMSFARRLCGDRRARGRGPRRPHAGRRAVAAEGVQRRVLLRDPGAAHRARRGLHPAGRVLRRRACRSRRQSERRCSRSRSRGWPSWASPAATPACSGC